MAESLATQASRGHRTLCLPFEEESYRRVVGDPAEFRRVVDACFRDAPELFPAGFAHGYELKDHRISAKRGLPIRRILLRDGVAYSLRPSFLTPYLAARTGDVEAPLFLRTFGVPFWALARVFGRDPMYWYRLTCGLGRSSVAGTTVRRVEIPIHLLADEHHQTIDGEKVYVATTVGDGCVLGAEPAAAAGTADLTVAYGVFKAEARDVEPTYASRTVSVDGWTSTHQAWLALFPLIVLLRCFLHGWLNIRSRGKLSESFRELSKRVWESYHAPSRRSLAQRLRRLREWAQGRGMSAWLLEQVEKLCGRSKEYGEAYSHPGGHRTSNMLDRMMRGMNRYFDRGQHLHGSPAACRAWALLANYAPWHPAVASANEGWRCPAERLNRHRYHDDWLQNLLISASLGGYRSATPQNP
ncbi:hypothetical protein SAMN05444166_1620 [Singulisphaera sp. GP187]|uniref:hypothetical protein n=1 Tax=Singulisphaera sp. GP187 TaxID=1882752 RepID=UPI00092690A0|nr:hypothetical protein [Singulisphaera sp. GP187]SIN92130.1 hypothetical protein SAMN05444166_1620 [Singulisphaera sp. GP187]